MSLVPVDFKYAYCSVFEDDTYIRGQLFKTLLA